MTAPRLLAVGPPAAARLRAWLGPHGAAVDECPTDRLPDALEPYAALVLDGTAALPLCHRVSQRPFDDRPLLLYWAPDDAAAERLAGFAGGADAVIARSAPPDEWLAQVRILERWQQARGRWRA